MITFNESLFYNLYFWSFEKHTKGAYKANTKVAINVFAHIKWSPIVIYLEKKEAELFRDAKVVNESPIIYKSSSDGKLLKVSMGLT